MLTIAAPTRTSCIRSRYWRRKARQPGSFSPSASLFRPYCARRRSISAASSPVLPSTPSFAETSSAVMLCQAVPSRPASEDAVVSAVAVVKTHHSHHGGAVASYSGGSSRRCFAELETVGVAGDDRAGLAAEQRRGVRGRADRSQAAALLGELTRGT